MTQPSQTKLSQPDSEAIYYQQTDFVPDVLSVFHGFFSRRGGVSKDVYASLNCGSGSDDAPEKVKANRKIVSEVVGCGADQLLSLHQIHSADCLYVDTSWNADNSPQADAAVTDKAGVALGILTADCAPVLFNGVKSDGSPVVGAAHAGWGGAFKGVLGATVKMMVEKGAQLESIRAAIGPCISQVSYEVGEEYYKKFVEQADENERFFKDSKRPGHFMFDLSGYCALRVAQAGVKTVLIKDLDTYFNEEDFFSYRRATHRQEKDYGRQISVVMIK